jgi:hypothetical protein
MNLEVRVSNLIEVLVAELERPRELSRRVLNYIGDNYNVDHDAIGAFLVTQLPGLEDYEIDLILSPVFTPKLADQAVFADLLGRNPIPREEWPALIRQLADRPVRARLVTLDGQPHSVELREVTVERYVHRLRLEASIPESLFTIVDEMLPEADRPLLKAIARRSVFDSAGTRDILERYLTSAFRSGNYTLADALELLNLMENRKPGTLAGLMADLPRWQEALRQQIEVAAGPKPFFSQDIERMHGGGRDQRSQDDARLSAKENEFAFLGRLQRVLNI